MAKSFRWEKWFWRTGFSSIVGGMMLAAITAQADDPQDNEGPPAGTTIRVGPDRGAGVEVDAPGVQLRVGPNQFGRNANAPIARSPYWIGMVGGDVSEELRMHLNLEDTGVIVRQVAPDSPAEEAGLQKHDIVLTANGEPVAQMRDLVNVVRDAGQAKGQVTIELIRKGRPETIWITPTERPAQPRLEDPAGDDFGRFFGEQPFGGFNGAPFQFRAFGGNGQVIGGNGISIFFRTENGKTLVTAKRGDETWEFDANDPQALEQLPPEVRQMVEGVLQGRGAGMLDGEFREILPDFGGMFRNRPGRVANRGEIQRRIDEMQRQVQELRQQMLGEGFAPPAGLDNAEEAPAFQPQEQAEPVEIDIPGEANNGT